MKGRCEVGEVQGPRAGSVLSVCSQPGPGPALRPPLPTPLGLAVLSFISYTCIIPRDSYIDSVMDVISVLCAETDLHMSVLEAKGKSITLILSSLTFLTVRSLWTSAFIFTF